MPKSNELTPRQSTFAYLFASGKLSGAEAARRAGYALPGRAAWTLKKQEPVRRLIESIRNSVVDPVDALAEHLDRLAAMRDAALDSRCISAAVAAEIARGRAAGFLDRRSCAEQPTSAPDSLELVERLTARLADPNVRAIVREALAAYPD